MLVYKKGDNTDGVYTVAKSDFAPYGDWGSTEIGDYNNYKLKLDINESYFLQNNIDLEKNNTIVVYNNTKYVERNGKRINVKASTVDLFNNPKNLVSEYKIGEIPNNSKVVIIDTYKQSLPQGYTWIAYKIKYKNKKGWIGEYAVKK